MRRSILAVFLVGVWMIAAGRAVAEEKKDGDHKPKIAIRDDCAASDPAWVALGGCTLTTGAVTVSQFNLLLFTPHESSNTVVGHPAWRMDPTYVRIDPEDTLRITNTGGRHHTFTEVTNFGGGFVSVLNGNLLAADECKAAAGMQLAPGDSVSVTSLGVGDHRFQCCIHPWMRILVKVEPEDAPEAEK